MMQNDGAGFLSGAAGGFFGSLGATAWGGVSGKWEGIGGKYAGSSVGTIAFGALSGGVGAELSGGNFWQGAIAGGIVAGLNDVMHEMGDDGDIDPPSKKKPDPQSPEEQAKYAQDIRNLSEAFDFDVFKGFMEFISFNATLGRGVSVKTNFKPTYRSAYKHKYKYDSRVRARGVEDPTSHNFPYSFDDKILSIKPTVTSSGYKIFRLKGTMNDKNGVFEIGLKPNGVIDHRFFRPTR